MTRHSHSSGFPWLRRWACVAAALEPFDRTALAPRFRRCRKPAAAVEPFDRTALAPKFRRCRNLAAAVLAVAASACATTPQECDPTRPDFFNNTACLALGLYPQRTAELDRTLADERRRNEAFRAMYAALQQEQDQVRGGLAAKQAEAQRLDRAWQDLKAALQAGRQHNQALQERIDQINRDVVALEAPDTAKIEKRDALRKRLELLQREADAGLYD